ncbi:transposase [Methylomarinovum caldicuralii]|uniref:Transposase n=1 Tax=Methylomarinovum caldicuralii TaxID=438856 RepID=A0AAU9CKL6_9GAMM|nr:ISAs1 family transposase [Methylomarinovum caldicuralii]BCX82216.1 transposase [Methylomarinovum caldicuralii]
MLEKPLALSEVFVSIPDPRQSSKVTYDLVEVLVVVVCAVICGADTLVEVELWAREKLDWLRRYMPLPHGIPSHDTLGRILAMIDPEAFGSAFQRWAVSVVPALEGQVIAIDGKTSRRSRSKGQDPLHLVSAFAAQYRLVVGQEAVADKSNEKTAIPALLETLALKGCVVTLDAMGTDPKIAKAIRDRGADYVLAVKDNQQGLAESIRDFFQAFQDAPDKTPHQQCETVDKAHGRLEVRRCYVFDQLDGLDRPQRWPDLACFAVVESERTVAGKTTRERRFYISSLPADAERLASVVRQHWAVENPLHWCMDVVFNDDQVRLRTRHAAHNLALLKQMVLNLFRLDSTKRRGGIKARRLLAASSDHYRAQVLGWT